MIAKVNYKNKTYSFSEKENLIEKYINSKTISKFITNKNKDNNEYKN